MKQQLDPTRECGSCTECCTLHGLAGETERPCRFLVKGVGCGIHKTRPESCRTWYCQWRYGLGLDEHRPDRIGVVPHPGTVPHTLRLALSPGRRTSEQVDSIFGLLHWMFMEKGLLAVWIKIRTNHDEPGPAHIELTGPPKGLETLL